MVMLAEDFKALLSRVLRLRHLFQSETPEIDLSRGGSLINLKAVISIN